MKGILRSCVGFFFLLACSQPSSQVEMSTDEAAIREARRLSNNAIAERDTLHLADYWTENFLVISSRDYQIEGKEKNRKLFVNEFNSKPDVIYVRTPQMVTLMEAWNMAAESGTWEGSWTDADAKIQLSGSYYAKWHKIDGRWLIRAEIFTPADCSGGSYCDAKPVNN